VSKPYKNPTKLTCWVQSRHHHLIICTCSQHDKTENLLILLAHWNNNMRVDISPHSDTLSWFQANHSLLFLLNAACLAEKQQIPILYSLIWPNQGSNPRSTAIDNDKRIIKEKLDKSRQRSCLKEWPLICNNTQIVARH
jgi:hypothetical protein